MVGLGSEAEVRRASARDFDRVISIVAFIGTSPRFCECSKARVATLLGERSAKPDDSRLTADLLVDVELIAGETPPVFSTAESSYWRRPGARRSGSTTAPDRACTDDDHRRPRHPERVVRLDRERCGKSRKPEPLVFAAVAEVYAAQRHARLALSAQFHRREDWCRS